MKFDKSLIPDSHPRKKSLEIREKLIDGFERNIVATAGLFAHGRGEAFDYLIGEKTTDFALDSCHAAIAMLLLAKHPVISVNGNVAALVPNEVVQLGKLIPAPLEINLFYYRKEREDAIKNALLSAGATEVYGVSGRPLVELPGLESWRRRVDSEGIAKADVVVVPLEDGDRTEALKKLGKKVITIDLNPMSRTAQWADITIVDNLIRVMPNLISIVHEFKNKTPDELKQILGNYNNSKILSRALSYMSKRLQELSKKGQFIKME